MHRTLTGALIALCLVVGACSSDTPSGGSAPVAPAAGSEAAAAEVAPDPTVTTSVPTSDSPTTVTTAVSTTVTSAVSTTLSATAPTVSAVAQPGSALVLRGDGLGPVKLGDGADESIAALGAILGAPTADSGWYDEQIGCDIGVQIRDVQWSGLLVQLSNGPSRLGPAGKEHVLSYFSTPETEGGPALQLQTDRGITLGDPIAKLKAAYPDVVLSTSEIEGPVFDVAGGINGNLSAIDSTGTVQSIRAGEICID